MKHKGETSEEIRLCQIMESSLFNNFPLANNSHIIQTVIRENIHMAYLTNPSTDFRMKQTHFDIQVEGRLLYILSFGIVEPDAGQGNGRRLYNAIKSFAGHINCTKVKTTPSGQGLGFWPEMGFRKRGAYHEVQL